MTFTKELMHPIFSASIGGTLYGASLFSLYTDRDLPFVKTSLRLPGRIIRDFREEQISINAEYRGGSSWTAYTGYITGSFFYSGETALVLRDAPSNYINASISAAYRQEKASRILSDILDASNVTQRNITCPSVTIDRIAFEGFTPYHAIRHLIETIKAYTNVSTLRYFFDSNGIFRFGSPDDTGVNDGESLFLNDREGIISERNNLVVTLPAPLRHSQVFSLRGQPMFAKRTRLIALATRSRLEVWYG